MLQIVSEGVQASAFSNLAPSLTNSPFSMECPKLTDGAIAAVVLAAVFGSACLLQLVLKVKSLAKASHSCGPSPLIPAPGTTALRFFKSNTSGLWVHKKVWPATAPRAFIYLVHGFGEHCARYEAAALALAARGFTVVALDHQGHGQSEGDRAYFPKLDHLVADVLQLTEEVPAPAGVPRVLFGHSMGGLVAIHAAAQARAGLFTTLVLSGPALDIDPRVNTPLNRALAKIVSRLLPKMQVQALDSSTLAVNKAVAVQYLRDPLNYTGGVRARVGHEMLAGIDTAVTTAAARVSIPTLVVHGEDDRLCAITGSKKFLAAMRPDVPQRLIPYGGLFHEILNEAPWELIVGDVAEWIEKHALGGGGGASSAEEVSAPSPVAAAAGASA